MTGERSTATSTTVPAPRQPGGSALTMRLDGDGTVIHASSELLDLLGRPSGDVVDVSLESLVRDRPPLSVQRVELASHLRTATGERPITLTVRRISADPVQLEASVEPAGVHDETESVIADLIQATQNSIGADFLRRGSQALARMLDMPWVLVVEPEEENGTGGRVVAGCHHGAPAEPFRYDLAGTPCMTVTTSDYLLVHDSVAEAYPDDTWLAEQGLEFYFGTANHNRFGDWAGHVVLLDTQPRHLTAAQVSAVRLFSARFGAEMARMRIQDELEQRNTSLQRLTQQDQLTGVWNRTPFREALQRAIARQELSGIPGALVHVDLDDFRGINERFGLSTGDAILAETGRRLREALRDADIVGRVGSDEFGLLIENIGPTDASPLPGALDALARPFRVGGRDVTVRSSGGIAYFPEDADNTDELTRMASSAAQRAKQAGGGHALRYTGDVPPEREELELTPSRYDTAVQNGEFQLHYQPIVNLRTGAAVSWEALARWQRDSELLPPAAFLPAAERNGVIIPFGYHLFEQAMSNAAAGFSGYLGTPTVSVNLSRVQFNVLALTERLLAITERHAINPSDVILEVTETTVFRSAMNATRILHELRDSGFRLALDDFGTGQSSLGELHRLPFDILKIDKSFVWGMTGKDSKRARTLVEAMIDLADRLGMTTIAEGVETQEQLDLLRRFGCRLGQGFLFGKPMRKRDISLWLESLSR